VGTRRGSRSTRYSIALGLAFGLRFGKNSKLVTRLGLLPSAKVLHVSNVVLQSLLFSSQFLASLFFAVVDCRRLNQTMAAAEDLDARSLLDQTDIIEVTVMTHWPFFWCQLPYQLTGQCVIVFQYQIFVGVGWRWFFCVWIFSTALMLILQLHHHHPQNWTPCLFMFSFCWYHLPVKCVVVSGTRRPAPVAGIRNWYWYRQLVPGNCPVCHHY